MNPNESNALHILHVLSALILLAFTFFAFAAPESSRKKVMIWTGIANLVILLTAFACGRVCMGSRVDG